MIDFIISKMGILLFAVSVASILLLLSISIKDIFIADEGIQLSGVISKQLKEMADSQSLCVSKYVALPRVIDVIGGGKTASPTSLYYYLDINISSYPQSDDKKFVVFSLVNKRTLKTLSVESFITNADIKSIEEDISSMENTGLRIDPTENNILYLVKNKSVDEKTLEVKSTIFFVPCKYNYKNNAEPMEGCYIKLEQILKDNDAFCIPRVDITSP